MIDDSDITEQQLEQMQDMVHDDIIRALKNTYIPLYNKYCDDYDVNVSFTDYLDGNHEIDEDVYLSMLNAISKVMQVEYDDAETLLIENDLDDMITEGLDVSLIIQEAFQQ